MRKKSRMVGGSADTMALSSGGESLLEAILPSSSRSLPPLIPLSVSELGSDHVAVADDKFTHLPQPPTVKSEANRSDNFNQSRWVGNQQVAFGLQSHCESNLNSSNIPTTADTVQRHSSCAVVPASVPTICVDHMLRKRGSVLCPRGGSCNRYHSKNEQPYQWQRKRSTVSTSPSDSSTSTSYGDCNTDGGSDDVWIDFGQAANIEIERAFCDESNSSCMTGDTELLKWNSTVTFHLDFEHRTFAESFLGGVSPQFTGRIRRLRVAETDTKPAVDDVTGTTNVDETSRSQYLTVWQWFWFDDVTWQAYESKTLLTAAGDPSVSTDIAHRQQQLFSLTTGYVFSETIEQAYNLSPLGWFSFSCLHPVDSSAYVIDFRLMVQMNQSTGRRRPIRRRPAWQLPGRPPTPVDAVISTVVRFSFDMEHVSRERRCPLSASNSPQCWADGWRIQ